jgi:hypothetical protein
MYTVQTHYNISVLPQQYLVPELWHMGVNIVAELWYEVLLRKHQLITLFDELDQSSDLRAAAKLA